jgi:hypothetical protein
VSNPRPAWIYVFVALHRQQATVYKNLRVHGRRRYCGSIITRSLISVSNATQTIQSLLYFKMSLKSHLTAICFGLTRPSSGNCSLTETAAMHHFVCHVAIKCHFRNILKQRRHWQLFVLQQRRKWGNEWYFTATRRWNIMFIKFSFTEVTPVKFEVFPAVTMKNAVFWDVAPCRF